MSELILESGTWQARIRPAAGGLIVALTSAMIPILRTMPEGAVSPLEAACFPMVPWCNRIAQGRFAGGGQAIELDPNFAPEPHAIHGHGWQAAWQVTQAGQDHCTLTYRHPEASAGWPWAYEAEQRILLCADGCATTLTVTNRADTPMPAGLGLHPYFRRRPESRVSFQAANICEVDDAMIPTGRLLSPASFGDFAADGGAALPPTLIDHCFAGWSGSAIITDDIGTITITASGAQHLHLFAPEQAGVLCLEPVSHLPNAINARPMGMALLEPGAQMILALRIAAQPA